MGCFDTLHSDDHDVCVQVKCLGRALRDLQRGDTASLHEMPDVAEQEQLEAENPVPRSGDVEALSAWTDHPAARILLRGRQRPETSWQILVDSGVAVFRDGRFDGFSADVVDGLVLVDNSGRDATTASTNRGPVLDGDWACMAR